MNWHTRRGRLRLMLTALLTVFAVSLGVETASANPPNESNTWAVQRVGGDMMQSLNADSEAYSDDNHLLQVWRGDNNGLYFALDHGGAYRFDATTTLAAPRVISFGNGIWAIFHTGTDGHIYWTTLNVATIQAGAGAGTINPRWASVPSTTTSAGLSPEVARVSPAFGRGARTFLLAYRSSTDDQLYSQYHDGVYSTWYAPEAVEDAESESTPALVWNTGAQTFNMFFRGTDNHLWATEQVFGGEWTDVFLIDGNRQVAIGSAPSVQSLANGDMQVAVRDTTGHVWYWEYYTANGGYYDGPTRESTDQTTNAPPLLVGNNHNTIWTLLRLATGYVYWKQSMKENSLGPLQPTAAQIAAARAAYMHALTTVANS